MVYGNVNAKSGTGICSTRCPTTGEKVLTGEFLASSEGEEVKFGNRSPITLDAMRTHNPAVYDKLRVYANTLENHFKDMQDIHCTVENKNLYILKSTPGQRSPKADVCICVDLVQEGVLSAREGLLKVAADSMLSFTTHS